MTNSYQDYLSIISYLEKVNLPVIKLGESISLASRIEPDLLRVLRLETEPELDASAEADLWFSPLVESRTQEWLLLTPPFADILRKRLAKNKTKLIKAHDIITQAHQDVPLSIKLEEEIIWYSLHDSIDRKKIINSRLNWVLSKLVEDHLANKGLARWFASAARRLPIEAKKTEPYSLLLLTVSSILDGRNIGEIYEETPQLADRLLYVLPEGMPEIQVWVALAKKKLIIKPSQTNGFVPIILPRTNPLILIIRSKSNKKRIITLNRDEYKIIEIDQEQIEIISILGHMYKLTPQPTLEHEEFISIVPKPALQYLGTTPKSKIAINDDFKSKLILRSSKIFDKFLSDKYNYDKIFNKYPIVFTSDQNRML